MRATHPFQTRSNDRGLPGRLTRRLAVVAMSMLSSTALAQDFAAIGLAPREATLCLQVDRRVDTSRWIALVLEGVRNWRAPIHEAWKSADIVVARLAPDAEASIHAVGPGGRRWLHGVRWHDPVRLQTGLQRLGSRPMGGGRFQLPTEGLDLVVLDRWILFGPRDSPWLGDAAERLRLQAFDAAGPGLRLLGDSMERAPIEIVCRHPEPIRGATAIGIHPTGATAGRLEIAGSYGASPLPIRTVGAVEADLIDGFEGRVAGAVVESGIGLLDPLLIRGSLQHPEVVPDAALRRRFAARRILVLDGEPTAIDPLGIIEVPAACIAVPVRSGEDQDLDELDREVDAWLTEAGRAVRRGWTSNEAKVGRTRGDDIRHLPLNPGLLAASDGHPMALAASLNWTVHRAARGGTWLVAGTTPGLVRRVVACLDDGNSALGPKALAMAGVASPARLAMQLEELAELRRIGGDDGAEADAFTLATAATFLDRIERVIWRTTRQDDHEIRATAEVRLVPGGTPVTDHVPDSDTP